MTPLLKYREKVKWEFPNLLKFFSTSVQSQEYKNWM
jgi:hypothetical protein